MSQALNYFLPYQVRWITDESRTAIAEKSRRVGFTYAEAYRSVERRLKLGTNHYFASRDRESAGLFLDDCKTFVKVMGAVAEDMGEQVIDKERDLTAFVLRFANGSKIMALSSNPDAFRGKGGDITLDEFAFHPQPRKVLKGANASAKIWGHEVRIVSTHNGDTNLFYRLCQEARAGTRPWGYHHVSLPEAVEEGLVEKIKNLPAIDPAAREKFLADTHADCVDESEWAEEYMCIAGSEESAFLSYDLIGACERADLALATSPEQLDPAGTYYAGYDVGRSHDLSVLWVIEKVGDTYYTRMLRELAKVNYTAQEGLLNVLMACPAVKRLCIDKGLIGGMLAERQEQRWGHRVEGVQFNAQNKVSMGMPLLRLFQDRLIRVPASDVVREDLHKTKKQTQANGNVRLVTESDDAGHADRFWALALAVSAADTISVPLPAPMERKPAGW